MSKREQYNLFFSKRKDEGNYQYDCYQIGNNQLNQKLAAKLTRIQKEECEGLIENIVAAQNNQYYEQFFSLDWGVLSDEDEIEILPPNVIIDKVILIPFGDMIGLLQEWKAFISN